MISTSDGSLPEEEAKAFAKQYAKELGIDSSGKKDELIQKIIDFHTGNNKENEFSSKWLPNKWYSKFLNNIL